MEFFECIFWHRADPIGQRRYQLRYFIPGDIGDVLFARPFPAIRHPGSQSPIFFEYCYLNVLSFGFNKSLEHKQAPGTTPCNGNSYDCFQLIDFTPNNSIMLFLFRQNRLMKIRHGFGILLVLRILIKLLPADLFNVLWRQVHS